MVRTRAPEVAALRGRDLLDRVLAGSRHDPVTHVEQVPPRPGRPADWPDWAPTLLVDRLARRRGSRARGSTRPRPPTLARAGRSVVIATGTASGKSLAYQLPVLSTLLADGEARPRSTCRRPRRSRPTSCASLRGAALPQSAPRPTTATPRRRSATGSGAHAGSCSPTRTCCTAACCRGTRAGRRSCARLRYVVVDECHSYRGVFGSHVAQVLRRLRRVCARYGAVRRSFVLASATVGRARRLRRAG